jgi:hypothetical protein
MAKDSRKYSEWSEEEKAEYKAKRDAWIAKRKADKAAVEKELEDAINALPFVTNELKDALAKFKEGAKSTTRASSTKETYMHKVFGTDTPAPGTVVTFAFIGMRGADNSRMTSTESTAGDLVKRTGDVKFLFSATDINSMVWYLNKYGNSVLIDKDKMTVTFVHGINGGGSAAVTAPVDGKNSPSAAELKAQIKASGFEPPIEDDDDDEFEDYEDDDDEDLDIDIQ